MLLACLIALRGDGAEAPRRLPDRLLPGAQRASGNPTWALELGPRGLQYGAGWFPTGGRPSVNFRKTFIC